MSAGLTKRELAGTATSRRLWLNIVGISLLVVAALWAVVSADVEGGSPWRQCAAFVALGAAVTAGRSVGSVRGFAVTVAIAAGIGLPALVRTVSLLAPTVGWTLGYANADAALIVQGIAAALIAAHLAPSATWRSRLQLVAVGMLALLIPTGSAMGIAAGLLVLVVGLSARRFTARWPAAVICLAPGLLVVASLVDSRNDGLAGQHMFDHNRRALWQEAVEMLGDSPWTGIGPGAFDTQSVTARSDADLRWAHSLPLGQGAEQGYPAIVLLSLLLVWVAAALLLLSPSNAVAALGAASVAAFGMQTAIDYVAEFPLVALTGAVLFGVTTSAGRVASPDGSGKPGLTPP